MSASALHHMFSLLFDQTVQMASEKQGIYQINTGLSSSKIYSC